MGLQDQPAQLQQQPAEQLPAAFPKQQYQPETTHPVGMAALQQGMADVSLGAPTKASFDLDKADEQLLGECQSNVASLQNRLNDAYKEVITLNCEFRSILGMSQDRHKALMNLAKDSGVIRSAPCFVEDVVIVMEEFAADVLARRIVLDSIRKITFLHCGTNSAKSVMTNAEAREITFGCNYETEIFTQEEIRAYISNLISLNEKWLLLYMKEQLLPAFQARVNTLLGKEVPLVFDIDSMIAACPDPALRLRILQTVCHEIGLQRQFWNLSESSGRSVSHFFDKLFGLSDTHSRESTITPSKERLDSPRVLLPLLFALTNICHAPGGQAIIQDCISEIHFRMIPGNNPGAKTLAFHQNASERPLQLLDFYQPEMPKHNILVYTGCFECGEKGCFTQYDVERFLETHLLVSERRLMEVFFNQTIPSFQARLEALLGHPVKIVINWDSMFPPAISTDADLRLEVTKTLCDEASRLTLLPIIESIEQVASESLEAKTKLSNIGEICIECEHSDSPPVVIMQSIPAEPASAEVAAAPYPALGTGNVRVWCKYPLMFGSRGTYDQLELRTFFRKEFDIPTPGSETGIHGMGKRFEASARRAGEDIQRIGQGLTKHINEFINKLPQ